MTNAELKKAHARFAVGDHVRHYGTKQWGKVIEVRPVTYGVELVVERIVDHPNAMRGIGYWEGARIDLQRPARDVACHSA